MFHSHGKNVRKVRRSRANANVQAKFCISVIKGSKAARSSRLFLFSRNFLPSRDKREGEGEGEGELGNTEFGKFANTTTTARNKVHGRVDGG